MDGNRRETQSFRSFPPDYLARSACENFLPFEKVEYCKATAGRRGLEVLVVYYYSDKSSLFSEIRLYDKRRFHDQRFHFIVPT